MYQDFDDPWGQTTEKFATDKAIALNAIMKLGANKVIELGCGLGHFTNKIASLGVSVLGIDISTTAINRAKYNYPECHFTVGDILDFSIYDNYCPDMIVMSEITWYVLDKLDRFIEYLKEYHPLSYMIHILTVYPSGDQKYGVDKFTNLSEIMSYYKFRYLEWGEISRLEGGGCKKTYFVGQISQKC
ncbi:MAG: class I SAM-dependent methyltransferase [Magnetococcus sp. DMHC-1]